MSAGTIQQLERELTAECGNAPSGLLNHTRFALPTRPSAFNAVTHGLSGEYIILSAEELPIYAQMALNHVREMKPVGAREMTNAQLIFEGRWRLHRILSVENALFFYERPEPAAPNSKQPAEAGEPSAESRTRRAGPDHKVNAFREEARNIDVISRYETRLIRNSGRLTAELETLQKERARTEPNLVFDKESSPLVIWYQKLQARSEALLKARQEYDEAAAAVAAASAQADATAKANPTANPEGEENNAAEIENPFGKISPSPVPEAPADLESARASGPLLRKSAA